MALILVEQKQGLPSRCAPPSSPSPSPRVLMALPAHLWLLYPWSLVWAVFLSHRAERATCQEQPEGRALLGTHSTWRERPWESPEATGLATAPRMAEGLLAEAPGPCRPCQLQLPAWLPLAPWPAACPRVLPAESPGCHSAPASCVGHSALNVTFPSRAGSRRSWGRRDCASGGERCRRLPNL